MSFGVGVGDIIALLNLANSVWGRYAGCPEQYKAIQDEISAVTGVLRGTETLCRQHELTEWQKETLEPILKECRSVLGALNRILERASCLEPPSTAIAGLRQKTRAAWARVRWDPAEIRELRARLSLSVQLLGVFNSSLTGQMQLATADNVNSLAEQQRQREQEQEKEQVLSWLSKTDFMAQQADVIRRRYPGTGQRLLESEEFRSWVDGTACTLFCPGIPGAGKTVMAATVIDYLCTRFKADPSVGIAYFYSCWLTCEAEDVILRGILKQLVQRSSCIPEPVKSLYDRYKGYPGEPTLEDIASALRSVALLFERTFVIIDALDEIPIPHVRRNLLTTLFGFQEQLGSICGGVARMSVLATSRHIPEINAAFEKSPRFDIRARDEDVSAYLDGCMPQLPSFVLSSPALQSDINAAIVKVVDGMFLLAQLHLNSLKGKRSPKAIKLALEQLPTGLGAYDAAYQALMTERIPGQGAELAKLAREVISWVARARTTFTPAQLQHAIAVEPGTPSADVDEDSLTPIELLVSVCAGLIVVDEASNTIRLVHYTAQEYFKRTQDRWFPHAETDIARVCIACLSSGGLKHDSSDIIPTRAEAQNTLTPPETPSSKLCPLFLYAADFWGVHTKRAITATGNGDQDPGQDKLNHEVLEFLRNESAVETCAKLRTPRGLPGREGTTTAKSASLHDQNLHMAARYGLDRILATLLEDTSITGDLDIRTELEFTPLLLAAHSGHEACVRILIQTGRVDPETTDDIGRTALHHAAYSGHVGVARQLLETGRVKVNHRDDCGRTPLFHAARYGYSDLVGLLLDAGADSAAKDVFRSTPLSVAAQNGHVEVVRLLLPQMATGFDAADLVGRTPLSRALLEGHSAVVKLLLGKYKEAGIDIPADEVLLPPSPEESNNNNSTQKKGSGSRNSEMARRRRGDVNCDICTLNIADSTMHYHCLTCHSGDFDICQDCYKLGARCFDPSHTLVARRVDGMLEDGIRWKRESDLMRFKARLSC